MGMFNTIYVNLLCPDKKEVSENAEIQIKWQVYEARVLNVYHSGDLLEEIEDEYNNVWTRTDYICGVCSKQTKRRDGLSYIKTEDQKRHLVFVKIEDGRIVDILTEKEFTKKGVKTFVDYL